MSPEELLSFLENVNGLVDSMDHIKREFMNRGWSEHMAEQAALMIMHNAYQAGMAE